MKRATSFRKMYLFGTQNFPLYLIYNTINNFRLKLNFICLKENNKFRFSLKIQSLFCVSLLSFFSNASSIMADKGELLFGLSYYNDYATSSSDLTNKQVFGNYLTNNSGLAGQINYTKSFAKNLMYYSLRMGYDYGFTKNIDTASDPDSNTLLGFAANNPSIRVLQNRYEISPATFGLCLDNTKVRAYIGIGPTYTIYRLNFRPQNGDERVFNISGWGFSYQAGIMAKLTDTLILYTELSFLESPIRSRIRSNKNLPSTNPDEDATPDNDITIFVNPRYQRGYIGLGRAF